MKKGLVDFLVFISMLATIMSAIANYLQGGSYAWQVVSLVWMIAYCTASGYINLLEEEK